MDLEDAEAHMHLRQLGIQLQDTDQTRLWSKKDIIAFMEGYAHAHYDTILKHLTYKIKARYIDETATMAFLKSTKVAQSWPRNLWAQRTGAMNFQGIFPQIKETKTCPLCAKSLDIGITWHVLLECSAPPMQRLYQEWGTWADTEWESLSLINPRTNPNARL